MAIIKIKNPNEMLGYLFKRKATYLFPEGVPIFPPPHAITTYCLPSFLYVIGVA
tara:strand:+ start:331 stop:492 length:162 start_codon:yes stop_codon:yes gene_type:complete